MQQENVCFVLRYFFLNPFYFFIYNSKEWYSLSRVEGMHVFGVERDRATFGIGVRSGGGIKRVTTGNSV